MSTLTSHMNFRMSTRDKKITYARQKLLEIAEKDIAEMNQMNTLILNHKDWKAFRAIMETPIQTNKNLKKAIQFFNKLNESSI